VGRSSTARDDGREMEVTLAKLKHELETKGFVLMDGGLATELERKGCDLHHHLWSAKLLFENPLLIKQVHAGDGLFFSFITSASSSHTSLP